MKIKYWIIGGHYIKYYEELINHLIDQYHVVFGEDVNTLINRLIEKGILKEIVRDVPVSTLSTRMLRYYYFEPYITSEDKEEIKQELMKRGYEFKEG